MKFHHLAVAIALLLAVSSCRKGHNTVVPPTDTSKTYFSIRQYMQDQIAFYWGQPFSLNRFETRNGKRDSTMVNFYNMDWAPVYKAFLATDISAAKYLGKYRFSRFADSYSGNYTLSYDALDPKLFTKSLQIAVDPTNNRILNIYIQSGDDRSSQKLLYIPLKVIQIQDYQSNWAGSKQNLMLEYRFLE